MSSSLSFSFSSDSFAIQGGDRYAVSVLDFLGRTTSTPVIHTAAGRSRLVLTAPSTSSPPDYRCPDIPEAGELRVSCPFTPEEHDSHLAMNAEWVLDIVTRQEERHGALLVHGGLVEKNGRGAVLAGRSGAGKSTTSGRIPPPWRGLSDDATLIVPNGDGTFRARPWPTWGAIFTGAEDRSWELNRSVTLHGIFILEHGTRDEAVPLGVGEALCLLNQAAYEASCQLDYEHDELTARRGRTRRFAHAAAVVKAVRSYRLYHTLEGEFWKEMERVLAPASGEGPDAVSGAAPAAAGR